MPKPNEASDSREQTVDTNLVLIQASSALQTTTASVAAQQILSPTKFHVSDDYDRWESQVKDYLKMWEPEKRQYLLLTLADEAV
ncbi:unnamed protein product [Echinostoma caproni]|uniref:Gag-pol polyprotein n=1 Tax=Echinostoma caproni TaxID=27848 RepID=A0A183BA14_9TREM|nr:unnamed protein product [Echinostoma caproni]